MTLVEQILDRVVQALDQAGLVATPVLRDMPDAVAADELPCIGVSRGACEFESFAAGVLRGLVPIRLRLMLAGADREAALDALHQQIHGVLLGDAALNALGSGLRLVSTEEPMPAAGDPPASEMSVSYQIHILVKAGDLAGRVR